MKKLSKLLAVCAVLVLLIACAAFSVSASQTESTVTVPTWDDFAQTGFDSADTPCPHCVAAGAADTTPEWTQYTGTGEEFSSGTRHIYIDNEEKLLNLTAQLHLKGGTTVVWIKPGVTVAAAHSENAFRAQGGDLWILGGTGSVVTGDGDTSTSHAGNGGLMRIMSSSSEVYICGDVTIKLNRADNKVTSDYMGGLIDVNSGKLYMRGGSMIGPVDASSKTVRGCVVVSGTGGTFYMSGGRLKGSGTGESAPINFNGAGKVEISGDAYIEGYSGSATSSAGYAIYQKVAATTTIYGGTIVGGVIDGTHDQYGSALYVTNGTMNIYGGTIYGGSSKSGGAIYVGRNSSNGTTTATGTMNIGSTDTSITTTPTIYGGKMMVTTTETDGETVTERVGNGGAIYVVYGKLNINKGNIYANTQTGYEPNKGGAIYLTTNGTVNINGGTIYGGDANLGGTIYQYAGTLNISGGTVNGGTTPVGGAIYLEGGTTTVSGNGIINGSVAEKGGAFFLGQNATFSMTGGTVNGCTVDNTTETVVLGGAIYLEKANAETMTFTGGTINGGTIRRDANEAEGITVLNGLGASIYAENGTLTLGGTDITGGYAYQGCAVYMLDGTLTIDGSDITNAKSASYGGAIRMKAGALNMVSGNITGSKGTYGGSIYMDAGSLSISGGTISGGTGTRGGNINTTGSVTMTMTGGTISGGSGTRGGNLYLGSDLTMSGGTISGGTATEYAGGIFMAGNKTYNINGGTIENNTVTGANPGGNIHIYNGDLKIEDTAAKVIIRGGTASKGGNISVSQASSTDKSTVTINMTRADSQISGGTAPTGAGIYVQGKLTLTSGTINGGKSTTGGGCVYIVNGGTFTMNGGTLNGGTTTATKAKYGGCVHVYGGTFNLNDGTLNGGSVTSGAAVYLEQDSNKKAATMNMTGGTVNNGTVTAQGALAYVGSNTTLNMTGGVMCNTSAGDVSGIRAQGSGKVYLHGNAHIKASAGGRNAVDLVGTSSTPATLVLAGNARVSDLDGKQTNVHNITFQKYDTKDEDTGAIIATNYPRLRVANDWTGYASITDNFGNTGNGEYIMTVTTDDTTKYYAQCGTWDAENLEFTQGGIFASPKLIHGGADEGDLPVFGEDGKLMLPRAKAIVEGTTTWHRTADEAADTACGGGYAVLYKDDTAPITLEAGDTLYMDFNGFNAPVNGAGTLYGMDSSALANGEGTSKVTFEGVTVMTLAKNPATGDSYIAIKDGNTVAFHAVTANVTSVSIRPGTVGMYYGAQFVCDDTIKNNYLNNFGIAVSLADMPDEGFATDTKTLYTQTAGNQLVNGEFNSVLINNIMTSALEAATNKSRGEMPIYANAYMTLTVDGEKVTIMATNTSEFSLETLLQHVNTYWDTFPEAAQESLATNIYTPYVGKFETDDWKIYNIRIQANGGYTEEEEAILEQRRQTVMDYMTESISLLWRSDKTITYSLGNTERDKGKSFTIVKDRLYMGLPYVYGAGTQDAFLEYAGEPDENGIYTISNIEATALNYESYGGRVGNDCSGAVTNAWSQISASITATTSSACAPYFGVVPVGNYDFNSPINPTNNRILDTKYVVDTNGEQTMYEAYAMLKPGDAAYHQEYPSTKGNHIRMAKEVYVERNTDGTINGSKSYIIMLEQTRTLTTENVTKKHPETGETIYLIGGVDRKYYFNKLFEQHYIPVTIAELRDPSPVEETWVDDTLEEDTIDNLFEGSIITNRYLDSVRITIYNENGEVVQQTTGRRSRSAVKNYVMERFLTEKQGSMIGILNKETIAALEPGKYRCTVTVKLTIDDDYIHTARDFEFTK